MNCRECNTRLTRTAVGLMCLQCGQIEHAPIEPDIPTRVQVEHITTEPNKSSNGSSLGLQTAPQTVSIDGLRKSSTDTRSKKSFIRPQIDQTGDHLHHPKPAHQASIPSQAENIYAQRHPRRTNRRRPIKVIIVTSSILISISLFTWLSLQTRPQSNPVAAPLANLSAATNKSTSTITTGQSLSRDATRKQDLAQLATALNVYFKQTNAYPAGADMSALLALQTTSPPYLEQIPHDPLDGTPGYGYRYQSDGTHFKLQAHLENSNDPQSQNGSFVISE